MADEQKLGQLSDEQRKRLAKAINSRRVGFLRGKSFLAAYDVEAHLSRIFGFENWDKEFPNGKPWLIDHTVRANGEHDVIYGADVLVTIRNLNGELCFKREGAATGSAENVKNLAIAHDNALKAAVSQALKIATKTIGDQFGLSLYNNGSQAPLVDPLQTGIPAYAHTDVPEPNYTPPKDEGDIEGGADTEPPVESQAAVSGPGQGQESVGREAFVAEPPPQQAAAPEPVQAPSAPPAQPPAGTTSVPLFATSADLSTYINNADREIRQAFRAWRIEEGIQFPNTPEELASAHTKLRELTGS